MNMKRPHKPSQDSAQDNSRLPERGSGRDFHRDHEHRGPERQLDEPLGRDPYRRRLEGDEAKVRR